MAVRLASLRASSGLNFLKPPPLTAGSPIRSNIGGVVAKTRVVAVLLAASAVLAVQCPNASDINIEGYIRSAADQSPIVGANAILGYRPVAVLDPGQVIARTDTAGFFRLRATDVPCEGANFVATSNGFVTPAPRGFTCEKELQRIDWSLQPSP